jgi:hypothetical protein
VPPWGASAAAAAADPDGPYRVCHRLLAGTDGAPGLKTHGHGHGHGDGPAVAVTRALGAALLASEASRVAAFAGGAFFTALWDLTTGGAAASAAADPRTPRRATQTPPRTHTSASSAGPSPAPPASARQNPVVEEEDDDSPARFAGLRGRPYASVLSDPFDDDDGLRRGRDAFRSPQSDKAAASSVGYF